MADVEIRLSGTIDLLVDGETVVIPGRRVRALLVMLALSAGRAVSVDSLARGMWGDDPPERVRGSLQTYVGRLRRAVGAERVITEVAGYRLDLPSDAVDLLRFERLVTASADAVDAAVEAGRLDEALALWTGEPFGDAPSEWIEAHLVPELVERHLQATERRIDLDLGSGAASTHLPQLRNLVEQHPLRETLWARLLAALGDTGRTAEALERYEALRNRLADELGVDPSPELRRVHHDLLTKELPADAGPPPHPATPRQLPPATVGFTGRSEQIRALDATLAAGDARLVALHGPGGVGKTSLAVHWATRNRDRFPDGQLFVDLRGYGPGAPIDPPQVLDMLLRSIGVAGERIPADAESRTAMLRTELSSRHALVVLDNARDAAQVRPLLSGGTAMTVVTSRSQLRGLVSREGAVRIPVEPMPTADAVALLADRIAVPTEGNSAELAQLADLCGRLPVALAVAAERAGRDGSPRIAEVSRRLRVERERLATLTDWSDDQLTDVRAVFSWTYQALDADTARMFRLLGRHPDPRVATGAAAALAGVDDRRAERLLDRLTDRHLLSEVSPGWYELHDLAHAYAAELVDAVPDEAAAAVLRLRNWYLLSVRNARYTQPPPRIQAPLPDSAPLTSPATFDSAGQANDWLADHHRCIGALLEAAEADGDTLTVARMAPLLFRFFKYIGSNREAVNLFTTARECARRAGEPLLEANSTYLLGHFLDYLGDTEASLAQMKSARAQFAALDHANGALGVDIALGTAYAKTGRLDDSIEVLARACERARAVDPTIVAIVLNNLATTYLEVGRRREAVETAQQAIEAAASHEPVDLENLATCHVTMGEVLSAGARWESAVRSLDEAVRLFGESGNVVRQILSRQLRGVAHREAGDLEAARVDWSTALELLDRLGAEEVPSHRTVNTGRRDQLCELLAELDASDAGR